MMPSPFIIRNLLLLFAFVFIGYIFLRQKQEHKLNWAIFFSALWVAIFLLLINRLSVHLGCWQFNEDENLSIFIPFDLYFVWVIFWGVLMPVLFRGRFIFITAFCLLCLDILVMPAMEQIGWIKLYEHWLWGELLLMFIVYLPAHRWVYLFLENKGLKWRSLLQFCCMAFLYGIGFPFMVNLYFPEEIKLMTGFNLLILQIAFIALLPSIVAVIDLAEKGKGTPFPYDPTLRLVDGGVYAYIRNPIQWSLTVFFIPLALYFQSYYLLLGVLVSIAYTIGVSEPQEKESMKDRFGDQWTIYTKKVPLWYFSWRPVHIPVATMFFKKKCGICSATRLWFEQKSPINLRFEDAENFQNTILRQVTYQDANDEIYTSIKAIAHAFGHINLAWASLGWFMRLPGIHQFLQLTIDNMGLFDEKEECVV